MSGVASRLAVVRRAVRALIDDTPQLQTQPALRDHLAKRMVGISLTAADLLAEDERLSSQIARRAHSGRRAPALSTAQAAGDFHRRTAVDAAAGVLGRTKDAIDFPGFVTSLITGVFQAMTTSTIQQLQAIADLLDAVNASSSDFASTQIDLDRAAQWATNRFPALTIDRKGKKPRLILRPDAELPDADQLKKALDASDDDVGTIEDDNLEETLLPLVKRKLARDRQAMLSTMVLMGLQRIVVDDGRIHASMNLQVDARSTAEQQESSRFDTRVSTSGSGSFGTGMWGASASLSATVGYVTSDDKFSREDIALRAGLRSSVDVAFHTEPLALDRVASKRTIQNLQTKSIVPDTEKDLLTADERKTTKPKFDDIPQLPTAADPGSDEQRKLREKKNFGPPEEQAETANQSKAPADHGGGGHTDAHEPALV